MLFRLLAPPEADRLWEVTLLVGRILDVAATLSDRDCSPERVLQDEPRADEVLRFPSVKRRLDQVCELTQPQREALRHAFRNDVRFGAEIDSATFDFLYRFLDADVKKAARELMVALYENAFCKSGFPDAPGGASTPLNRQAYHTCFREANYPRNAVCPVCLTPMNRLDIADCDHFFPKAQYPVLAVYGLNLVFICGTCNERRKASRDPIRAHSPGAIRTTFLPYHRPACEEVEPDFSGYSTGRLVTLVPKANTSPETVTRLGNLERVFSLSEVLSDQARADWTTLVKFAAVAPGEPTRQNIERYLTSLSRYSDPEDYLKSRYAAWIVENCLDEFVQECESYSSTRAS